MGKVEEQVYDDLNNVKELLTDIQIRINVYTVGNVINDIDKVTEYLNNIRRNLERL